MVRAVRRDAVPHYVTLLQIVNALSGQSAKPSDSDGVAKDLPELRRYIRRHPELGLPNSSIHDLISNASLRGQIAQGQDGVYVTPRGYEFLENHSPASRNL